MATIRKEIPLRATADQVWDVIRDVGAIHTRLAPGFVVDTAEHHNASFQVFPAKESGATLVWISDFLPDTATAAFSAMIDAGSGVIKRTLDNLPAG